MSFVATLNRELLLAWRRPAEIINPLFFFVMVVALFPLGVSPKPELLATLAPGVVWVAALLAVLLSVDGLFRADHECGALEQLLTAPQSLYIPVLAKLVALVFPMRVDKEAETNGLDLSTHGERAYDMNS